MSNVVQIVTISLPFGFFRILCRIINRTLLANALTLSALANAQLRTRLTQSELAIGHEASQDS